jgi:hypothetical protein
MSLFYPIFSPYAVYEVGTGRDLTGLDSVNECAQVALVAVCAAVGTDPKVLDG